MQKEDLLKSSDFVTVHLVSGTRNIDLIAEKELGLMKPTAFLVNTSRSEIINQKALIKALKEKQIAGAGIDVFPNEPLPLDSEYRKLENLLATPHLGYVADTNYNCYFSEAVECIHCYLNGSPIRLLT